MKSRVLLLLLLQCTIMWPSTSVAGQAPSIARIWNEQLLDAIRMDLARPTVHARNLFHFSVVAWDAWAVYDQTARGVHTTEKQFSTQPEADRVIAISHASFRLLTHRFSNAPDSDVTLAALRQQMLDLGLDPDDLNQSGNSPVAVGNRIADRMITIGLADASNEVQDYANLNYEPVNPPLLPDFTGNPDLIDANRWQPLALDFFIDQSGNIIIGGYPDFLSPEWGLLDGFALSAEDRIDRVRDGYPYRVFHDPGPPPLLNGSGDQAYRDGAAQVVDWSGLLDPTDGVSIDIGPGARGNNTLGSNDGSGHSLNPATGLPYPPNVVPAGDYYRVLAEFWADGPNSETPPGHWFSIANTVADHPDLIRRIEGRGLPVSSLEWDVKLYLALGGAMHDSAISAWSVKGWYDGIRPVSAIRHLCDLGQSTDPGLPSFDPSGIPLLEDRIAVITAQTIQPGGIHEHLAGNGNANLGQIAVRSWRGPGYINDPDLDTAGVGWILCGDWWPYQRPSFVSPPFAGYVSGHSTFSRAAAEVMTRFTGDAFFPGGQGSFPAPANDFLVFEQGPSTDIELQWATYRDAADECSLSRIYGGIHPPSDDIPGRLMGFEIGNDAMDRALQLFGPSTPTAVPTMSIWSVLLMMGLLSCMGMSAHRAQSQSNRTSV